MKALFAGVALVGLMVLPAAAANSGPSAPLIVTPSQLHWNASAELPAGGKMAVVAGDPAKAGWYVVRISLPAGAKFPPHYHGGPEYVTVLSGTFLVGLGDTMNAAKMTTLPAGSYVAVPTGVHHYAMAKDAVVLELSGPGPMTTTMVKM
ncbi:MAG: cupin domain-containing protein [Candidatus Tumulicola sp.]